jgi:hypothetical protein
MGMRGFASGVKQGFQRLPELQLGAIAGRMTSKFGQVHLPPITYYKLKNTPDWVRRSIRL